MMLNNKSFLNIKKPKNQNNDNEKPTPRKSPRIYCKRKMMHSSKKKLCLFINNYLR